MQVLTASVNDVRYIVALLQRHQLFECDNSMSTSLIKRASVTLSADLGIIVTVEEARTLLGTSASLLISGPASSQLSDPHVDLSTVTFEIPLNTLIECLNIYGTAGMSAAGEQQARGAGNAPGSNRIDQYFGGGSDKGTRARLSYCGAEDSSGPTTTCEIVTFDPEPFIELPFDGDRTLTVTLAVLKIIFKSSSWLRDALSELDPSCDKITFISNPVAEVRKAHRGMPAKPLFRIIATGTFGTTEMDYPNDREVLETFECFRPMRASYNFAQFARTLRALQSSTKTSLRIDDEGLLSLQFLVPVPKPRAGLSDSFIEFRCLALDEEVAS
ncbi:Rad1/Rec1/Rad17 [Pisolithus croceorrhizus]|nr:Rad1/Rec1/Rad17 [Pisolithus croceorrhizus]